MGGLNVLPSECSLWPTHACIELIRVGKYLYSRTSDIECQPTSAQKNDINKIFYRYFKRILVCKMTFKVINKSMTYLTNKGWSTGSSVTNQGKWTTITFHWITSSNSFQTLISAISHLLTGFVHSSYQNYASIDTNTNEICIYILVSCSTAVFPLKPIVYILRRNMWIYTLTMSFPSVTSSNDSQNFGPQSNIPRILIRWGYIPVW